MAEDPAKIRFCLRGKRAAAALPAEQYRKIRQQAEIRKDDIYGVPVYGVQLFKVCDLFCQLCSKWYVEIHAQQTLSTKVPKIPGNIGSYEK